jgi:hypothetical protein
LKSSIQNEWTLDCIKSCTYLLNLILFDSFWKIFTPIVHDKKEQKKLFNFDISLENSESSLPLYQNPNQIPSLDSSNEIVKGGTFSNERFPINFAQSSEL